MGFDNGSVISKAMDRGTYGDGVKLGFSRPGKPEDNAFIQSFNAHFRNDCLNVNWVLSIEDAWEKIDGWINDYKGSGRAVP